MVTDGSRGDKTQKLCGPRPGTGGPVSSSGVAGRHSAQGEDGTEARLQW